MSLELALKPFEKGPKEEPDRKQNVRPDADIEAIQANYKIFDEWADGVSIDRYFLRAATGQIMRTFERKRFRPLEPLDIESLIFMLMANHRNIFEGPLYHFESPASAFLTPLIQVSFEAGHNDFRLPLKNARLTGLCTYLRGRQKNRMRVQVDGDIYAHFGRSTRYCDFVINGSMVKNHGHLGNQSRYSTYRVSGTTNLDAIAFDSGKCTFYIYKADGQYTRIDRLPHKREKNRFITSDVVTFGLLLSVIKDPDEVIFEKS